MKRAQILVIALLLGAAAPARAWCEASCLLPSADAATPHCATQESEDDRRAMSASAIDDCPVVESARPSTAKIEFVRAPNSTLWHRAPAHLGTLAPWHPGTQAPVHRGTDIPLRI
ncbi:MAG TPA: hypothetical protein VFZ31_12715 [Vicinamibacterales bacterium]